MSHLGHRLLSMLPHEERHALSLHQHRPDHQVMERVLKQVFSVAGVDQVRYACHHVAHNTSVAVVLKVQDERIVYEVQSNKVLINE